METNPSRGPYSNYVTSWKENLKDAYEIALRHSRNAAVGGKQQYDKKAQDCELKTGDRVLVRNHSRHEGPSKLQSYWEPRVYVVLRKMNEEIPVYEVQLQSGQGKKRGLHRNLLLQSNELPLDTTPTKVPRKASSSKVPYTHSQPEESEEDHRSSDSDSENDMSYMYRGSHVTQTPPDDHNDSPHRQTRRPQRDRRPKRLFTYDRLGSPTQTQTSLSRLLGPQSTPVFKFS
ncbi:hypothetical protein HOLleu_00676 [Holothuria leucospilota]|uniref:Uncharacterized protein n=1 Tax=Holothuria leucospilota TaxID=206669 RepID=A0A9Q1CNB1_HOLLE|nr:hypothetical protein HOLleu_00676 [Holothuria leucospilota]